MQSDKFDSKIKVAADQHHPVYDEKAWEKMEKLLDKHLPEEKQDRRRFIYILLFFLLLSGAGYWYFSGLTSNSSNELVQSKEDKILLQPDNKKIINEVANQNSPTDKKGDIPKNETGTIELSEEDNINPENQVLQTPVTTNIIYDYRKIKKSYHSETPDPISDNDHTTKIINKEKFKKNIKTIPDVTKNLPDFVPENNNQKEPDPTITKDLPSLTKSDSAIVKKEPIQLKKGKNKTNNNNSSFFFISVSAGPELSFVGSEKPGAARLLAGIGLGYSLKNRFVFRTGFYSDKKIYSATAKNYNPPPVFSQYYPILENVDADCTVYEIPLSVSYNFRQTKKQNWFVSTGISSYLMKREYYNYTYKYTPSGPTYQKDWTIHNKNKHFFSVVTLSGGLQRQISKKVSVTVEPFIKLPLKGVGYGKVKLNSSGVLFSISVKPFDSFSKPHQ